MRTFKPVEIRSKLAKKFYRVCLFFFTDFSEFICQAAADWMPVTQQPIKRGVPPPSLRRKTTFPNAIKKKKKLKNVPRKESFLMTDAAIVTNESMKTYRINRNISLTINTEIAI